MKTKIFITVGYLVIAIFAFGQNKQSTKAKILSAKVENSIQSKRYEISVNYVNPMTGKPRNLTPDYSIRISDDSTYVYLPYFGRAYSAPMNGEGGIRIANLMNNYKVDNNKGKNYSIGFTAKGTDDTYRFSITVWTNGRASVLVTCNNRQAISYNGNLRLPDN
jgi:hypothetical protein